MDNRKRNAIQAVAFLVQNANFKGFFTGRIYQGSLKQACVPGLNCYSCPGALGACPLGALQNGLTKRHFRFPYYVVGLLLFFGALLGRAVCGFLCPFGWLQELVYRIPFFKKIRTFRGDRPLRYVKYVILLVMVIAMPIYVKLTPFFCKYLCPSGTVAGILLAIRDGALRAGLGSLFMWKVTVLVLIILGSLILFRFFCRYLCPLGAIYGLCNRFSMVHLAMEQDKCVGCGSCKNACPMCVDPVKTPDSAECIRCGRCASACRTEALHLTFGLREKKDGKEEPHHA